MSNTRLIRFLQDRSLRLVLADIGASGDVWEPFKCLLPVSDLLRFDPDLRAMHSIAQPDGSRCITINKVVVESDAATVDFYLTKSPYCSSTLLPDFERIRDYPYEELFEIVGKSNLPATTLEKALISAGCGRIDWIKLDTQGTEVRILRSLPAATMSTLLACDIEASLYAHYTGADVFPDAHSYLLSEEFWVAEMTSHLRTRGSRRTLDEVERSQGHGRRRRLFEYSMHREPTSLELTYLRTLRGVRKSGMDQNGLIRLFACHYAVGAFEYCVEIIGELASRGLSAVQCKELTEIAFSGVRERMRRATPHFFLDRIRSKLERWLRIGPR